MKEFFESKIGSVIKALLVLIVLIALFDIRVSWQFSMPDDKDFVCSIKSGKGYVVSNGFTGVFLRRAPSMDEKCEKFIK